MKIGNRIFTGFIAVIFAIFSFTWIYDAMTGSPFGQLSTFYPQIVVWLVPLGVVIAILICIRFHLAGLMLGIGLLTLSIMTGLACGGGAWYNPFRPKEWPTMPDLLLTGLLYSTFILLYFYILFQIFMLSLRRDKTPQNTVLHYEGTQQFDV
ncbi:MAG: hypothetical protein FWF49_01490 [Oscillospiraceae bacterium]|nr:hypothetical protein [Oscillospiraceae bacterium]